MIRLFSSASGKGSNSLQLRWEQNKMGVNSLNKVKEIDMKRDEVKLIDRARRGDRQAVGKLYERHFDSIYNYVYYRVDNQATAEDLSTEVFIRMLENLDGFSPGERPFLAWLYTIARNLVIDYYREDGENPLPIKDKILKGTAKSPAKVIEKSQSQRCYTKALYHLTEDQRRVIIHKFIDELSTAETAQLMGKTEGAVRSLQHRALRSLKEALEEEECL